MLWYLHLEIYDQFNVNQYAEQGKSSERNRNSCLCTTATVCRVCRVHHKSLWFASTRLFTGKLSLWILRFHSFPSRVEISVRSSPTSATKFAMLRLFLLIYGHDTLDPRKVGRFWRDKLRRFGGLTPLGVQPLLRARRSKRYG